MDGPLDDIWPKVEETSDRKHVSKLAVESRKMKATL